MLKKDYSVVVKKHCVFPMFFSTTTYTNLPYFGTYFLKAVQMPGLVKAFSP